MIHYNGSLCEKECTSIARGMRKFSMFMYPNQVPYKAALRPCGVKKYNVLEPYEHAIRCQWVYVMIPTSLGDRRRDLLIFRFSGFSAISLKMNYKGETIPSPSATLLTFYL